MHSSREAFSSLQTQHGCGLVVLVSYSSRLMRGMSREGRKVRTLTVGAGEEEGSDCLRLGIVVGFVVDAG
jgi:hypothetical protein